MTINSVLDLCSVAMSLSADQRSMPHSPRAAISRHSPRTSTRCHALLEDALPQILSVDRSVYAALASCLCTLCAVHLTQAWQPTAEVSAHAEKVGTSRRMSGGQPGVAAQVQKVPLTDELTRDDRNDSTSVSYTHLTLPTKA